MQAKRSIAFLFTILFAVPSAYGDDKTIPWLVVDWPPINILAGGAAPATAAQLGTGIVDREMAELIAGLPGYQHTFFLANSRRVWASMANGENRCFASAFKTPEREKIAYFRAIGIMPAVTLVVRGDNAATSKLQFPSASLAQVIQSDSGLAGNLEAMRSYGPVLDAILDKTGSKVTRISTSYPGQLLRALDLGRMDYTLEYPMTVEYLRRVSPFNSPLETIPLSDAAPLVVSYVACTRNPWGEQAIADIERVAKKAARRPVYRNAVRAWMSPALTKQLGAQMDQFYDELASGNVAR